MRLLLDTHIFLWAVTDSKKLKAADRKMILSAESVYVSAASIWEIAIKSQLGKIEGDPEQLADAIAESGFIELPVNAKHAAVVSKLKPYHADPFDRLLIAQAITEPLRLMTADSTLAQYSDVVDVI